MKPLISVILPVYNQSEYLDASVRSVLNQTISDIELIVVNDGSTEDVHSVLNAFRDPRMRVVDIQHKGLPHALNIGLKSSKAPFVTWTSADNVMARNCLEVLYDGLRRRHAYSAAYADYYRVDRKGRVICRMSKGPYRLNGRMNFGPAFLMRTSIVRRVGLFDEKLEGIEDRDYAVRMALAGPVLWVPQVVYRYRVHSDSLTGRLKRDRELKGKVWEAFRRKWAGLLHYRAGAGRQGQRSL